ncbi:MAG TPA: hypothetical protein VG265_04355, partial [Gaiellaceae bacterium]|nr:hypothetical protein [Gaiellaceae bacterium]
APTSAGTYQWIATYSGDGANNGVTDPCGAANESVTVTAPVGPTLGVSTTSVPRGTSITVTWSGVASPSRNDLIGVFVPGTPNTASLSFIYDSTCTTSSKPPARASGSCSFTMPSTPGTYELRLLGGKGSTLLATSPSVTTT